MIAALELTNALAKPTPTTPFKQPGTDRMQEIKKLAAIFESMAPKRTPVNKHTEPTPKNDHPADTKGADIHGTNTKGASTGHT
jgi:hypothetical protein